MKFPYFTESRKRRTGLKMGHFSLTEKLHAHHHGKEHQPKSSSSETSPTATHGQEHDQKPSLSSLSTTQSNRTTQQSPKPTSYQTENGFLKVQAGDVFQDGRFVVQKQLGSGRYSNVWLVQDQRLNQVAALKILGTEFYHGVPLFELEVMRRIRDVTNQSSHPGRHHVMEFIDDFEVFTPTGRHVCMVFGCLGPSLQNQLAKANQKRLPCAVAKHVSRQLLEAMDFLHNECGVLHTDINTSNILIDEPARYANPENQAGSATVFDENLRIRLSDFGLACWQDRHLTDRIQPLVLRAPEITVGGPWEASVDVYSIGCLVHYFVVGEPPFYDAKPALDEASFERKRLSLQAAYFGPVPKVIVENASRAKVYFDTDGQILPQVQIPAKSVEQAINEKVQSSKDLENDLIAEDIPVFCDFLNASLATDPRQRKCPRDLANHAFLNQRGQSTASTLPG